MDLGSFRLYHRERGIGLLELMLALAIIAVLIIMATRYYQTTARSSRLNDAVTQINGIIAAAEQYRVGAGSFDGLTGQKLVDMGFMPSSNLNSPWGTAMEIQNYYESTVYIRFKGIQAGSSDCKTILQRIVDKNVKQGGGGECTIDYRTTRDE